MEIASVNPATGETIRTYPEMPPDEVERVIQRCQQAHLDWRDTSFAERAGLMRKAAGALRASAAGCARLMAGEMGKPVKQGRAEAEKCAWACDYYAENAEKFLQPEEVVTGAARSFVTFRPLGAILAIMPWNYPFWQVFRFAAPALMAGNAVLLKHASNVPGCALAIEELFRGAGFPPDLFAALLITGERAEAIIENPLVRAVTVTGGTTAGRAIARKAGDMVKKTVLELGGSDPYVILDDADLEAAAATCAASRLTNSGQSCIAAKRFVVVNSRRERFEELMVRRMREARMGDPMEEETTLGPLARRDLRDELHRQVRESIDRGAKCLLGGAVPGGPGAFYPPTVLTDVRKGMPAYDEEVFGPVAAIVPVGGEEEAIRVANDSRFGLGAAVFTRDRARGELIAVELLEAGCCFVNTHVQSDPRLPFGGIKDSGYGRELSHFGIREFVNIKTVVVG